MERTAFLIVTKAVLADKRISTTAKFVLAQLMDHRNKQTGQCNPRIRKLAEELGISISTAGRALRALREVGLVKVIWRQRASCYEILFGQNDRSCSVKMTDQDSRSLYEPYISRTAPSPKSMQREEALARYYAKQQRKAAL
jgi:DNA-binding transcriptional MocR family regulator